MSPSRREELVTLLAEFLFIASPEDAREVLAEADGECLEKMLSAAERLETE